MYGDGELKLGMQYTVSSYCTRPSVLGRGRSKLDYGSGCSRYHYVALSGERLTEMLARLMHISCPSLRPDDGSLIVELTSLEKTAAGPLAPYLRTHRS